MTIDLARWSALGQWVVEECPEQPDEEPQPMFQCDHPNNAAAVARIHNELCDEIRQLRLDADLAEFSVRDGYGR